MNTVYYTSVFVFLLFANLISYSQEIIFGEAGLTNIKFVTISSKKSYYFTTENVDFRWYGLDGYKVKEYDTLWHKVSKVDFAYGQSIDVSAIKFIHSGNKRWNTMWGECQLFTNPNFNNRYCYLFGMVEQPSFIIGVPLADSSFLKDDIKDLEKIWNDVGTKKENF